MGISARGDDASTCQGRSWGRFAPERLVAEAGARGTASSVEEAVVAEEVGGLLASRCGSPRPRPGSSSPSSAAAMYRVSPSRWSAKLQVRSACPAWSSSSPGIRRTESLWTPLSSSRIRLMPPFLTEILGDFISSAPERAKTKIPPKSAASRYQIVTELLG